ncbi:ATP-binding cassette domain-containing protein [Croceicoccus hydrothermalis]|uniref:ATP-binding cassette domain-containing protein n=1 Tax=Croceicoccus hydrothermalis TaxID=2867964 RepID=UPI001EFBBD12|nr:ATP-binding cassette domain-containing protein [Croceicoccus hydrothermalis]
MSFDVDIAFANGGAAPTTLRIASGAALIALTGFSGVGKTSALNCIAGLRRPIQGRIAVGETVLFDAAAGIDLPPERRRAGYVFQENRLFPHYRVSANLTYGEALRNEGERWMTRGEVTDFLGIGHLLDRWPATLSGGEAKRVAIGRALLSAPRFLLLDEPLAAIDPARRDDILTVIERIRDTLPVPILYVSHHPDEIARLTGVTVTMGRTARE